MPPDFKTFGLDIANLLEEMF